MAEFVRVASLSQLPPGEMLAVDLEGEEVALANVDGQIFAFGNICTHLQGPLATGDLDGDVVTCPWHRSKFNVKTGKVVGPPAKEPVPTYQVQVQGDDILVASP